MHVASGVITGTPAIIIHEVQNKIDFPLQLAVPGFTPFVPCATLSILDIVVPTFYISFISRFGRDNGTNSYYLTHVIAYAASLGIFTLIMVYSGTKQPALLYIIPTLFFATFATAGIRKEWGTKLSIDSTLNSEGKLHGQVDPSARSMARFDSKKFQDSPGAHDFKKFEDENGKEEEEKEPPAQI